MKKKKDEGGLSLDDAFADDDDVEYAKAKPRKVEKKEPKAEEKEAVDEITIKASKPIGKIKKGDKIKVDSLTLEVDAHYVLIDHGSTKEMTIELFDPKTDKEYQIRYFSDQLETSIQAYVLEEIIYNKLNVRKIEW